jgi:hypothetical protein
MRGKEHCGAWCHLSKFVRYLAKAEAAMTGGGGAAAVIVMQALMRMPTTMQKSGGSEVIK